VSLSILQSHEHYTLLRKPNKDIQQSEEDDDCFLQHVKKFAGYHHEKWDGTGYPNGLKGGEIPLHGRIMAVADVYGALVSERPYKKPFTHEQTVEIIYKQTAAHTLTRKSPGHF